MRGNLRLLKKLCEICKINNGQGERILESLSQRAVMKCEHVLFWLSCSVRMQCSLIPILKKHLSSKCALSQQVEQAESL